MRRASPNRASLNRASFALAALTLACIALFTASPGLDPATSALFYRPATGFWLIGYPSLETLRNVFWSAADLLGLAGLIAFLAARTLPAPQVPPRLWGFVFAVMALGPGVLVNVVVKPIWGRARPADTTLFGGAHTYSRAFALSDQCHFGCSFVSGESASAVAMSLILGMLFWHGRGRTTHAALIITLTLAALVASALRVMTGRHFLSDITFGGLLAAATFLALFHWMRIADTLPALTTTAIRADLTALARPLTRR